VLAVFADGHGVGETGKYSPGNFFVRPVFANNNRENCGVSQVLAGRVSDSLHHSQGELDAWVVGYNQPRLHQASGDENPSEGVHGVPDGVCPGAPRPGTAVSGPPK